MKAVPPMTIVIPFAFFCLLFLTSQAQTPDDGPADMGTSVGTSSELTLSSDGEVGERSSAIARGSASSDGGEGQTSCDTEVTGDGEAVAVVRAGDSVSECESPSNEGQETDESSDDQSSGDAMDAQPESSTPNPTEPEVPQSEQTDSVAMAEITAIADGTTGETACDTSVIGDGQAMAVAQVGDSVTECVSPPNGDQETDEVEPPPTDPEMAQPDTTTPVATDVPEMAEPQTVPAENPASPGAPATGNQLFCELFCMVPALRGKGAALPDYCQATCPGYETPEFYLDPAAPCHICRDSGCSRCNCSTGECLPESESGGSSGSSDSALKLDQELLLFCAHCYPRKQCRGFWFCK